MRCTARTHRSQHQVDPLESSRVRTSKHVPKASCRLARQNSQRKSAARFRRRETLYALGKRGTGTFKIYTRTLPESQPMSDMCAIRNAPYFPRQWSCGRGALSEHSHNYIRRGALRADIHTTTTLIQALHWGNFSPLMTLVTVSPCVICI